MSVGRRSEREGGRWGVIGERKGELIVNLKGVRIVSV